jgi:hypothetical protein
MRDCDYDKTGVCPLAEKSKAAFLGKSQTTGSGLDSLHPHAFGLTRSQHEQVVRAARNDYAEAWIADRFGVSRRAVREICATENVIPARNELIDGEWKSSLTILREPFGAQTTPSEPAFSK